MTVTERLDEYLKFLDVRCPALISDGSVGMPERDTRSRNTAESESRDNDVLFIEDLVRELRVSRSTIERRRRMNSFPIPEMPPLNNRPRWSRKEVEAYKASTCNGLRKRRKAA